MRDLSMNEDDELLMKALYLRLSVTDQCNLRCRYCRPDDCGGASSAEGATKSALDDGRLLDLVWHIHQVRPLKKIRLTGGEPLIRPGLISLVGRLRRFLPVTELCLTTNGSLLSRLAQPLRDAGLDKLNISLDVADAGRFKELTGGDLGRVHAGLDAANRAGFEGLKLNAVLQRSCGSEEQLAGLVAVAREHCCEIRFIELMPMGGAADLFLREHLPATEALARLCRRHTHVGRLDFQGTAQRHLFRDGDALFPVGLISPISHPFCDTCNRLRLDSRGRLFSCLRESDGTDLALLLRDSRDAELRSHIAAMIRDKCPVEQDWPMHSMASIGG